MIYNNDKTQTEGIKKFLRDNPTGKNAEKSPDARKGTPSAPANRHLPIRSK